LPKKKVVANDESKGNIIQQGDVQEKVDGAPEDGMVKVE